jgi:hypothetical protein
VLVTFDLDVRFVAQVHDRMLGSGPDRTGVSEVQLPGAVTIRMNATDAARLIGALPPAVANAQDHVHQAAQDWRAAEQELSRLRGAVDTARRGDPGQTITRLRQDLAAAQADLLRAQADLEGARYLSGGDPLLNEYLGVNDAQGAVAAAQAKLAEAQQDLAAASAIANAHGNADVALAEADRAMREWWEAKVTLDQALAALP